MKKLKIAGTIKKITAYDNEIIKHRPSDRDD